MKILQRDRIRRTFIAFLATLLAVACHHSASAQLDQWGYWNNGVTESWWLSSGDFSREDAVNAVSIWKRIGVANQDVSGKAWAGDYFSGSDTHGTYMRWSQHAGFIIAHIDKCQAKVMGVTYGRVEASPTLVQFFPEFNKMALKSHGHSHSQSPALTALRFVPVEWGEAHLLVPEGEMSDFGDYIAGLGKYNYRSAFALFEYIEFLTKSRAGSVGVSGEIDVARGSPVVPQAYEHFLKRPIEGVIVTVGRRVVKRDYSYQNPDGSEESYTLAALTFVTVSAGSAHGLRPGMFLRVSTPDEGDIVRILRAGKFSSIGIVIRDLDENSKETFFDGDSEKSRPHSKIALGWQLTTSPF